MTGLGYHARTEHDDYAIAVDFDETGVFDDTPVTGATVAVTPSGYLTVGTPSVDGNVVTFRVSGGTAGQDSRVAVTATNGVDTVCRTLRVSTKAC